MKKLKYLLITILLLIPTTVGAEVNSDTTVGLFDTRDECVAKLELNGSNTNASNGYYLSCVKITCVNSSVAHDDLEPLNDNVTCANGNTNPYREIIKSGIATNHGLELGATCSTDDQDEDYLKTQYATRIDQFNCLLNRNGSSYTSGGTVDPDPDEDKDDKTKDETNPQTGIDTYYLVLGSTVVFLSTGLYIINKKNLFKKI